MRQLGGSRGLNLILVMAAGDGIVYFELQKGTMTGKIVCVHQGSANPGL